MRREACFGFGRRCGSEHSFEVHFEETLERVAHFLAVVDDEQELSELGRNLGCTHRGLLKHPRALKKRLNKRGVLFRVFW